MYKDNPILIAYYLPQFHPTIENDKWWGKGFTEWTNVTKAKPLFKGHYQPKIPSELGFYDLRYPEIKNLQAELAKEAGISAFCYWHYWMGNGTRLLNKPLDDLIQNSMPDFQFCLGWANHDWQKKDWSSDVSILVKQTLIKQEYGGEIDYKLHFMDMLPTFKDKRYLKINEKLVFTIFKPDLIPDTEIFFKTWNKLAEEHNLKGFYFIGCAVKKDEVEKIVNLGYDLINLNLLYQVFDIKITKFNMIKKYILNKFKIKLNVVEYSNAIKVFDDEINKDERIAPTIIPNWDHSPRSGRFGLIIKNATPKIFKKHVSQILNSIKNKKNKIIFIKSWNEWGEGNYLEPDLRFGKKFIEALAECLNKYNK
jgi:hypothetical protein